MYFIYGSVFMEFLLKKLQIPLRTLNNMTYYQIRSVAQSCPTLFDSVNRSTPGLPVHHQLLEFTETHVHQVSDAIQPSHPLSSPSRQAFISSGSKELRSALESRRVSLGAHWVDSRESSLLRRLERGREIGL